MRVFTRVITIKDSDLQEAALLGALQKAFGFTESKILEFRDYYKMPGHQVMGVEFEMKAVRLDDIFQLAGSNPVVLTESWAVYDEKQGSSINIDAVSWMNIEEL